MDSILRIYLEQIEPCTDTFSRLSKCLMQRTLLSDVLRYLRTINPQYTHACARRFLSHYMVHFFSADVVGEMGDMPKRVLESATTLFEVHRKCIADEVGFEGALRSYITCFNEWQLWDKAQLASTYRDVYRLLSEMQVSSPIDLQEPVEQLKRTIDTHTDQIFGSAAHEVRNVVLQVDANSHELELFVRNSVHEVFWEDIEHKLEQNSFEDLCGIIGHVKERMLALCTCHLKRDEVLSYLDVEFLQSVLDVGMAQNQVRSLLLYCLRFLREYGQPCHDARLVILCEKTQSLYSDAVNTIPLLVQIIREIAQRMDELVQVVCELSQSRLATE